jgi:prevent-host-death family protein
VAQDKVGIRDLKARLSGYMQEVKKGKTLVITERGRAIGLITPMEESEEEAMHRLVRSGFASWNGKKLKPGRPAAKVKPGSKLLSRIVSENRG